MGEIIARNMLSCLELLINRYCCIWLVVYIIVLVMHGQTNAKLHLCTQIANKTPCIDETRLFNL